MQKYKITQVYATDTKKDGTKMINKWGKPTWRVGIKTEQHGDEWINGFLPFNPDKWEGTEQELTIFEDEYNGKKQLKFEKPKQMNVSEMAIKTHIDQHFAALRADLKIIADHLGVEAPKQTIVNTNVPYPEVPYEEEQINPEDVPF